MGDVNCLHSSKGRRNSTNGINARGVETTTNSFLYFLHLVVSMVDSAFLDRMATLLKWENMQTHGANIGVENCIWEVWGLGVYDRIRKPSLGDVVVDAGAHIGSFTVRASQMVGETGKVYAFEPSLDNFMWLVVNTSSLGNVKTFHTALWSSKKDVELFESEYPYRGYTQAQFSKKVQVPAVTLDSIVSKVDFLKIDVELSELEVLKGAEQILENSKPFIVMEIHGFELVQSVESYLSGFGYRRIGDDLVFSYTCKSF